MDFVGLLAWRMCTTMRLFICMSIDDDEHYVMREHQFIGSKQLFYNMLMISEHSFAIAPELCITN